MISKCLIKRNNSGVVILKPCLHKKEVIEFGSQAVIFNTCFLQRCVLPNHRRRISNFTQRIKYGVRLRNIEVACKNQVMGFIYGRQKLKVFVTIQQELRLIKNKRVVHIIVVLFWEFRPLFTIGV